jgi:hypothetical protein
MERISIRRVIHLSLNAQEWKLDERNERTPFTLHTLNIMVADMINTFDYDREVARRNIMDVLNLFRDQGVTPDSKETLEYVLDSYFDQ